MALAGMVSVSCLLRFSPVSAVALLFHSCSERSPASLLPLMATLAFTLPSMPKTSGNVTSMLRWMLAPGASPVFSKLFEPTVTCVPSSLVR